MVIKLLYKEYFGLRIYVTQFLNSFNNFILSLIDNAEQQNLNNGFSDLGGIFLTLRFYQRYYCGYSIYTSIGYNFSNISCPTRTKIFVICFTVFLLLNND